MQEKVRTEKYWRLLTSKGLLYRLSSGRSMPAPILMYNKEGFNLHVAVLTMTRTNKLIE